MPEAEAVPVTGERMLRAEVEGLIRQLDLGREWTARIQALLRLEGLVKGGAAAAPGCMELLARLQAPITAQLLDRRSPGAPLCTVMSHTAYDGLSPRARTSGICFFKHSTTDLAMQLPWLSRNAEMGIKHGRAAGVHAGGRRCRGRRARCCAAWRTRWGRAWSRSRSPSCPRSSRSSSSPCRSAARLPSALTGGHPTSISRRPAACCLSVACPAMSEHACMHACVLGGAFLLDSYLKLCSARARR